MTACASISINRLWLLNHRIQQIDRIRRKMTQMNVLSILLLVQVLSHRTHHEAFHKPVYHHMHIDSKWVKVRYREILDHD